MVHNVIAEVDMGEPLIVREIEFVDGDTLESYEQRVHSVEWEVIIRGVEIALERIRAERGGVQA